MRSHCAYFYPLPFSNRAFDLVTKRAAAHSRISHSVLLPVPVACSGTLFSGSLGGAFVRFTPRRSVARQEALCPNGTFRRVVRCRVLRDTLCLHRHFGRQ